MAIPKKLLESEKDMELLQQRMAGTEPEPTPPANPEPPKVEEEPKEVVKANEEPVVKKEPDQPAVVKKDDDQTWEQRYKTLQGMYKKEVDSGVSHATQTYRQELGKKDQVISTLVNQIEELKKIVGGQVTPTEPPEEPEKVEPQQPPQPPQVIEPPELQDVKFVDKEAVVDELGDEAGGLVDTVNTLIAENQKVMNFSRAQADLIKDQAQKIQDLSTQVGGVGQSVDQLAQTTKQSKQDAFYTRLDDLAPQWKEYNENEDFNAWLDMPVVIPELPNQVFKRREFFLKAANAGDVKQVASFFNEGIKAVTTSVQTPTGETVVNQPDVVGQQTSSSDEEISPPIEEQVMPNTSGGGVGDVTVDQNTANLAELQEKMTKAAEKVAQARTAVARVAAQEEYDKTADAYQKAYAKLLKK